MRTICPIDYEPEALRLIGSPREMRELAAYIRRNAINFNGGYGRICDSGLDHVLTLVALAELVADGKLVLR
jgi:hypothetical protein